MENWRFLFTGSSSAAMNMAIDEAILLAHSEGKVPPTVRFYTWDPPSLSIGYFQQVRRDVDVDKLRSKGYGLVRRPTGGRAVLHHRELTYSIILGEEHPMMPSSVVEAYRVLSRGLQVGFQSLGLFAELVALGTEEERQKYASLGSAACFDSPSWYELVVEGKKVAGSAQWRHQGVILQHGSILLDLDMDDLFDILRFSSETLKQRMRESFAEKAVAINRLRSCVSLEQAVEAFYHGFSVGLHAKLEEGELAPCERELAERLEKKYSGEDWTFRR